MTKYISSSTNIILYKIHKQSSQMDASLRRLSSGKKINSAADNPGVILKISRLNSSIRGNKILQENIQSGISLLQTADKTFEKIKCLGLGLRDLAVKYQSNNISDYEKEGVRQEAKLLLEEMLYTYEGAKFNGTKLFSNDTLSIQTGLNKDDRLNIDMKEIISFGNYLKTKNNTSEQEKIIANISATTLNKLSEQSATTIQKTISQQNLITEKINKIEPETTLLPSEKNYKVPDGWQQLYNNEGVKIYEGNIYSEKFNGYGKWYDFNGNLIYDGNFKNGKYDGFGRLYNSNTGKIVYEGNFKENKYDGQGSLYTIDGSPIYRGELKNGMFDGYGTLYNDNGSIKYQGKFKNGKYENIIPDIENPAQPDVPEEPEEPLNPIDPEIPDTPERPDGPDDTHEGSPETPADPIEPEKPINPDDSDEIISDSSIGEFLNNLDRIYKDVLDPIAKLQNYIGIQQRILEGRSEYLSEIDEIQKDYLSKIQDTDIASELMQYTRAAMLKDVNATLLSHNMELERNFITALLK